MPTVVLNSEIKKIVRHIQGPAGIGDPLNINHLGFDIAAGYSVDEGEIAYNAIDGTFDVGLPGGVVGQMFQELFFDVRNATGSTLTNGTVVMFTGAVGASGIITVDEMDGTDVTNARYIVGILTEDIANGSNGKATYFGKVRGIDTTAWNVGDELWVSSTTPGILTNVEPTDGNIGIPIAAVLSSSVNGVIEVRVTPIDLHNFTGRLYNYEERTDTVSFASGTATENHTTCDNILRLDSLTQNSTLTFTNLMAYKPVTITTVADTGGPWTLSVAYGAKTISLTRNGGGTADLETFELWSDGTDIYAPDNGGLVWSVGS